MMANDHRNLGRELDLFHLQEEAPGAAFWHPKGLVMLRLLEERVRRVAERDGYQEVRSPIVMRRSVWEASGHWQAFSEGMLRLENEGPPEDDFALKPVSCPGHIHIVKRARPSWRDLPLRLSEHGIVHRNEPHGVLCGLFRLRQFVQDDGHVFCAPEHVDAEIARFLSSVRGLYESFGMPDFHAALSLRPEARFGDDALWDRAEEALANGARGAGLACEPKPGQGAFYGPKIELVLRDASGRAWQCGPSQLDVERPLVMLHRAMLGSFERFAAILLEHHAGRLPAWLAPVSVRVVAITDAEADAARRVLDVMRARGLRAELARGGGPLPGRVADARAAKVPFLAIVGARERDADAVVLRDLRIEDRGRVLPIAEAAHELEQRCALP